MEPIRDIADMVKHFISRLERLEIEVFGEKEEFPRIEVEETPEDNTL